ncbi:nuclear GTPase SLIP-GC-like [Leuresthes tenuis]|uniref:nuclear GTPase SLIP-GC-like n=1 Tax=Leuresthes tenuis TaxID=355514 RepID=UPI003B513885
MDDFVRKKLSEWGLRKFTKIFQDEEITEESFCCLEDKGIKELIPRLGPRTIFVKELEKLKRKNKPNQERKTSFKNDLEKLKNERNPNQERERSSKNELVKLRKEKKTDQELKPKHSPQVWQSTQDEVKLGKRKLDLQGESRTGQPSAKWRRDSRESAETILSEVKTIMRRVQVRLDNQDHTKLNAFLKTKIKGLRTDKRELIGVFGRTGAGKSSLINAVIGEKDLLPSGEVNACTSVMIKVEANMDNLNYEADIEFITKEEWADELWSLQLLPGNNTPQEEEDDEEYNDIVEKVSALYGEEQGHPENPMDDKYFNEIPEFLQSKTKKLTCGSAKELSQKLLKYTRSGSKQEDGKEVKRWYWPLVKCVTVRVPQKDILQHVTLVDLPGNGDRNKSRDKMWKGIVGKCSTVWIVAEINRAASEKESWDILKDVSSLIGNGGECRHIHFICTKTDLSINGRQRSLKRKLDAKAGVRKEFNKLNKIKKHFSDDCLKVFTVSSTEFLKGNSRNLKGTEIPKLRGFLQNLNDCHSVTLNYVSGAYGILSLIQGARYKETAGKKTAVSEHLERKLTSQLAKVKKEMDKAYTVFERCLSEGVEKSKCSCKRHLNSVLYPPRKSGSGFHGTLKCVVRNNGIYKPKKRQQINLNMKLASCLTDSIDEEFRKTFPNEGKRGPFNGVINEFSLDTEGLIKEYKEVKLQLVFLKTEVEKMKNKLNPIIRDRKKVVYNSLTEKIEEIMQVCYEQAAGIKGTGMLKKMRETIERHVCESENIMFAQAKDVLLSHLNHLRTYILRTLEKTLKESTELSLRTDDHSIPDVSDDFLEVKKLYYQLRGRSAKQTTQIGADVPSSCTDRCSSAKQLVNTRATIRP